MDATKVMAKFITVGDNFPLDDITNRLSIRPTSSYRKGDITKHNVIRKETSWCVDTGYEESQDINDQLQKIIILLRDKKSILIELKAKYQLDFQFMLVLHIEYNEKPLIYFEKDTIQFISDIGAEISFDYYIYTE